MNRADEAVVCYWHETDMLPQSPHVCCWGEQWTSFARSEYFAFWHNPDIWPLGTEGGIQRPKTRRIEWSSKKRPATSRAFLFWHRGV